MTIFLILAPYAAFATLMLATSAAVSLFASAAICLMVMAYDASRGRSIKMLGAGSVVLFLALGTYITLVDSSLSSSAVKLGVDAGVLAISLASLAIRHPFTLQYAREAVDTETAKLPDFLKANYDHLGVVLCLSADGGGQRPDDLCPGSAAVVRNCDCIRRPQYCGVFYQMVPSIPASKVCSAASIGRGAVRFLNRRLKIAKPTGSTTMKDVFAAMLPYIEAELAKGTRLHSITRHFVGAFHGLPGARAFRRHLAENAVKSGAGIGALRDAIALVEDSAVTPIAA